MARVFSPICVHISFRIAIAKVISAMLSPVQGNVGDAFKDMFFRFDVSEGDEPGGIRRRGDSIPEASVVIR